MGERDPRLEQMLPNEHLSFSGHETFVFRHSWLKKAVDCVAEDPEVFTKEDAIVRLGVGKNMVRSIRHWGLATGVLAEEAKSRGAKLRVSDFGQILLGPAGYDQYLEDPNTLWLLHWRILSQTQRCTAWHWVFNRFPASEFTRAVLTQFVLDEARRLNPSASNENSIRRDVDVLLRTYVASTDSKASVGEDTFDCPLSELGLIEARLSSDLFQIQRGPKPSLSDLAFAFALCEFWDGLPTLQQTLAFSEIAYRSGGPGVVFRLDENSIAERLERLEMLTAGKLVYTETAGLRQVYRNASVSPADLLDEHYQTSGELLDVEVLG